MNWLDALSDSKPVPSSAPGGNKPVPAPRPRGGPAPALVTTSASALTGRTSCCRSAPCSTTRHPAGCGTGPGQGKDRRNGYSATTGYADDADRLKVFTSSWPPFADGEVYTKFAAYALVNSRGDYPAAARDSAGSGTASSSRRSCHRPPSRLVAASTP